MRQMATGFASWMLVPDVPPLLFARYNPLAVEHDCEDLGSGYWLEVHILDARDAGGMDVNQVAFTPSDWEREWDDDLDAELLRHGWKRISDTKRDCDDIVWFYVERQEGDRHGEEA